MCLTKKGEILQSGSMPAEVSGAVLAIYAAENIDLAFAAYTSKGNATFLDVTTEMKEQETSTASSNYSFDGDGTFHFNSRDGQYGVWLYNNKSEARLVATIGITEGQVFNDYEVVFSYAIADNEEYEANLERGAVEKTLLVTSSTDEEVRTLEFDAPVRQVMSCRHHPGDAGSDDIYILLSHGGCQYGLKKVNGTKIFDANIENDDIGIEDIDLELDEGDEDEKYLGGFSVFGKKLVIYGSEGLYVAELE